LGLATFFAEQKTKEIGIRKVLGATIGQVISLLSKQFLILVVIGLLIGVPVSMFVLQDWLTKFEYRISLEAWMFAIPVILAIIVAVITIGIMSLKAAVVNPIKSLRTE
jgi:putative ABC transport system permease protein